MQEKCKGSIESWKTMREFDEYQQKFANLKTFDRVKNNIDTICDFHDMKYLQKYLNFFPKKCCNPFKIDQKTAEEQEEAEDESEKEADFCKKNGC